MNRIKPKNVVHSGNSKNSDNSGSDNFRYAVAGQFFICESDFQYLLQYSLFS